MKAKTNTLKLTISCFVLITLFSIINCNHQQNLKPKSTADTIKTEEKTFIADILTNKEEKFTVSNFRRNTYYTNLHLDIGDYQLTIPFEIIKHIEFSTSVRNDGGSDLYAKILLGDGSVIKGKPWGSFIRQTDLGAIEMDFYKIKKIEFHHTPLNKYSFKPHGTNSLLLQIGDSVKVIRGATFVDDFYENKCSYPDFFFFELKGNPNPIKVYWNKIKYLMPASPNYRGTDKYVPLKLITKENTEYLGYCGNWSGMAQSIEGVISYSKNYELRIRINIPEIDDKHNILKLEFK